jgi:tetratricopeptide (TPR) repeat protein
MISRRVAYLFISAALLIVYAPAIHSGYCGMDDGPMLQWLHRITDWDFFRHFFPEKGGGLYFRPLLTMTYVYDLFLWDASPLVMHIENILLHLLNSILVFELARRLLPLASRRSSYLPLLAALLFGLHPLNVESVAWISGRTDLLCATFVFLSAITTLKFKQIGQFRYLFVAIISLALGFLSKEIAIAFLPGAALILLARNGDAETKGVRKGLTQAIAVLVTVVAIFFVYYFVRDHAFTSNSSLIGKTLSVFFNDLYNSLFVILRAFGFYLKKIFLPFPLNFAIVAVDPLYELLAMPIIGFCLWLLTRRRMLSAFFLAGICLITPAFLIAFRYVAWTSYAERYLYLPLGFVIPALVCYFGQRASLLRPPQRKIALVVSILLLIGMGGAVFHRAYVWRSNVRLFADTSEKSPSVKNVWNAYGAALYRAAEFEKALGCFEKASSLFGFEYKPVYDMNHAAVLEKLGREDEAIELLRAVIQKNPVNKSSVYKRLIPLLEKKIDRTGIESEQQQLRQEIDSYKATFEQ